MNTHDQLIHALTQFLKEGEGVNAGQFYLDFIVK